MDVDHDDRMTGDTRTDDAAGTSVSNPRRVRL